MARKIEPSHGAGGDHGGTSERRAEARWAEGRWRQPRAQPTRAPSGEVLWWERPAPEASDPALWDEVQRLHVRCQQLGMSVSELARRMSAQGRPMRRETLSRVLNGKQPTTWDTAERLADILGLVPGQRPAQPRSSPPGDG